MAEANASDYKPPFNEQPRLDIFSQEANDPETFHRRLQEFDTSAEPALVFHTQLRIALQLADVAVAHPSKGTIEAAISHIQTVFQQENLIPPQKLQLLKFAREHLAKVRDGMLQSEMNDDMFQNRNSLIAPNNGTIPKYLKTRDDNDQFEIRAKDEKIDEYVANGKPITHDNAYSGLTYSGLDIFNHSHDRKPVISSTPNDRANLIDTKHELNAPYTARQALTFIEQLPADRRLNRPILDDLPEPRNYGLPPIENYLNNLDTVQRQEPRTADCEFEEQYEQFKKRIQNKVHEELNSKSYINPDPDPIIRRVQNVQQHRDRSRDGGWMFSLHQALNTIPHYDGNPDMLALFCRAVRDVIHEFGPESERWVLNSLASKFRGRAADGYTSRLTQYDTVERLLADLTTQYSGVGGADKVLADLKVIRQYAGEGAGDYGLRVQTLHNRLLNIYDASHDMRDWEKATYKNNADKEALEQFLFGLNGELQHQVRSKSPLCLREAISQAVAFEHRTSARRAYSQQPDPIREDHSKIPPWAAELMSIAKAACEPKATPVASEAVRYTTGMSVCNNCRQQGHLERDCKAKSCQYCNIVGHTYTDCFSLKNAINNGQLSKEKLEKLASAPIASAPPVVYTPFPIPTPAPVPYVVPAPQANNATQNNSAPQENNERQNGGYRKNNVRRYSGERNGGDNRNYNNNNGYNNRDDDRNRNNNNRYNNNRDDNRNYNNRRDDRGYDNRRNDRGFENRRNDRDFDNRRNDRGYDNRRNDNRNNNNYNNNNNNNNRYNDQNNGNYNSRNNNNDDRDRQRQDNGNSRNQSGNSLNYQDARYQSGVSGNQ